MIQIEEVTRRIAELPGTKVDRGFGQGRDAVRKQFELLIGEKVSDLYIEGKYESYYDVLNKLQMWVRPYKLPDDYLFFLEFCGGFLIDRDEYTLIVDGIGPMCHEWYDFPRSEASETEPGRDGLFQIGQLQFQDSSENFPFILFFIDLAGIFQLNSVLGIGPYKDDDAETAEIIANPANHQTMWKVLARSFTEWLELVVETDGTLEYA